jgi:hypothetical protein
MFLKFTIDLDGIAAVVSYTYVVCVDRQSDANEGIT